MPITLGGTADTLDLTQGLTLGGAVSGFAVGDLIAVANENFGAGRIITGATLGGGILTLTSDGTVADLVAMAGNAGVQFLTNAVGVPGLAQTDIVLPLATATITSAGTAIGGSGTGFIVVTGSGNVASESFVGNLALEGNYSVTGTAVVGGGSVASVLDIETAASLGAAAGVIQGGVEVDGAGASFIATGALTVSGGQRRSWPPMPGWSRRHRRAGRRGGAQPGLPSTHRPDRGRHRGTGAAGTLTIDAGTRSPRGPRSRHRGAGDR